MQQDSLSFAKTSRGRVGNMEQWGIMEQGCVAKGGLLSAFLTTHYRGVALHDYLH